MRRLLLLLALLGLLTALFAGCELRNRRPSSDFIPETQPTQATEPAQTDPPETAAPQTTEAPELVIREIYAKRGDYTDQYGIRYSYSYRLPFVDFASEFAAEANAGIDRQFRAQIDRQLAAMENREALELLSVDYETRLRGDMLTLYLSSTGTDGAGHVAVYSFNRRSGARVSGDEILRYLKLSEEDFLAAAEQAIRDAFDAAYGEYTDDLRYTTSLDKTLAEGSYGTDMELYLDDKDQLVILATIYDLAGAGHTVPLTLDTQ